MNELDKIAREATAEHLEKVNGYKVLDTDFMGFIVAEDDDDLVFCKFAAEIRNMPELTPCERREFEGAIVEWLITHETKSMKLRCDELVLDVCKSDGAVLRHHVNCC